MVEVVFENFVNYLRSGNTDKLNIISFQQNQQHKINLSTQLIFYRILTKTVVQLSTTISLTNGDVQQNVSKDILFKASEKEYCIKLESNLFRQFAKDEPDTLSAIISYESGRMPAESIIFYTKPANVQYMWVPIIINAVLCVLSIYLLQKCGCL
ncbi:Hypothetical_protein [Hexamita inflata]|uniref:Hypothetical_protein n=1 Tax=Hexamita inflata TaxID=28002 RepID=A0AA86Q9L7_9EUKA|nr:Hypothetical protein HINF_LOCUS41548 [Hexamita inflata]